MNLGKEKRRQILGMLNRKKLLNLKTPHRNYRSQQQFELLRLHVHVIVPFQGNIIGTQPACANVLNYMFSSSSIVVSQAYLNTRVTAL